MFKLFSFIQNKRKTQKKAPAIIYTDLECLLEKMHSCQNNLIKFYTKHTPSGYSLFTIVHLIQQKISLIVTEGKTVWKGFVKV